MARDYLNIGSSPLAEDCVQVGSDNYIVRSMVECRAFQHQIERAFPNLPPGVYFKIKSFPHDFGEYREVVVFYEADDEAQCEAACDVEGNTPEHWDAEALKEMGERKEVENGPVLPEVR